MEKIRQLLVDPSWWFSALFVGIVASVIAGYTKDYIGVAGAKVSHRYRTMREASQQRRQERLAEMAEDPVMLILFSIRTHAQILWAAILLSVTVFAPGIVESLIKASFLAPQLVPIKIFVRVVYSAVAFTLGYKWGYNTNLYLEALAQYRTRRRNSAL
ncbi:hypothetical protein BH23GEM5_BH23GEM5_27330 [soil metagenome]|jgi:uncharacterized membrane protein